MTKKYTLIFDITRWEGTRKGLWRQNTLD